MNHIGGGRNELDSRFLSLCSVFSLPFPSDDTIRYIFNSILSGHTKSFTEDIQFAVHNVINMTVHLYKVPMFEYFIILCTFLKSKELRHCVNCKIIKLHSNINYIIE